MACSEGTPRVLTPMDELGGPSIVIYRYTAMYRDNGKEHGSYYLGFRVKGSEIVTRRDNMNYIRVLFVPIMPLLQGGGSP